MRKLILYLFCIYAFSSCDKGVVFESFTKDFDQNRWKKTDAKSFEFILQDSIANYDLDVDFSHIADFQFGIVPIQIEMASPDGKVLFEHMLIQIKDTKGDDRGDCTGDYCDVTQSVFKNRLLKNGVYQVKIKNEFDNGYLPNVLGLGVTLKYSNSLPE